MSETETTHPNSETESTTMTDVTDTTNTEPVAPDFNAMTTNPMGRVWLAEVWRLHNVYVDSFEAVYPNVDKLPRQKAWRDALPNVQTIEVPADLAFPADNVTPDGLTILTAANVARLSRDAATVATIMRAAEQVVTFARENLDGLYVHAKSTRTPSVTSASAESVEAARLELANYLKMAPQMAASGCITEGLHWTFLPHRITDGGSVRYDGPSLPTSRKVSPIRANTKRLAIMVSGREVGTRERDLAGNVADILRLDMSELKSLVGDFTPENYGTEFVSPTNGVVFSLVLRDDATDEPEDDAPEPETEG